MTVELTLPWAHHPSTFSMLRLGSIDPTVRSGPSGIVVALTDCVVTLRWECFGGSTNYRATFDGTVDQPEATLRLLVGADFRSLPSADVHPRVAESTRRHRTLRIAGNGLTFVEAVKAVLGQRITGREAALQWSRLVRAASEPLNSYAELGLYRVPRPDAVLRLSTSTFHQLGIEERRARTIRQLADLALRGHLDHVTSSDALVAVTRDVVGFGPWSVAVASGNAFGDPDALPVGDFHLKNTISWVLAGRARGTDEEMVELLAPYRGWRWWVTRSLSLDSRAPRFDHRRRNIDIRTM